MPGDFWAWKRSFVTGREKTDGIQPPTRSRRLDTRIRVLAFLDCRNLARSWRSLT